MSKIIIPNSAEINLLTQLVTLWRGSDIPTIKLFQNNLTPGDNTVIGDFVEPTLAGYASKPVPSFSDPITDPNGLAYSLCGTVTFTATAGAPVTVYGYFIVGGGNKLLWCERWDAARTYGPANPVDVTTLQRLRQIP